MELNKKKIDETEEVKAEKVEEPKVEEKKEAKTQDTESTAKESSEEEKAPKAEDKVEEKTVEGPITEVKTEEKVEEKVEEKTEEILPTDMEFERQFDKKDEYEITVSKLVEFAKLDDKLVLEVAKVKDGTVAQLTYKQKKSLPDSMFAVVVKAKNKRTDKMRTIRKFPINDKVHLRNAFTMLSQDAPKETLKKLGVSIESVREKILARAKTLGIESRLMRYKAIVEKSKTYKTGINKVAKQLIEAKKQVELYKASAKNILQRQEELGEYAKELSDVDILNDDKFEKAKLEKENTLLKASQHKDDDIVGGSKKDNDYYKKIRKEVDRRAFGE